MTITAAKTEARSPGADPRVVRQFHDIRKSMQTPEQLGWAIVNAILTEGPVKGTMVNGEFQIPMKGHLTVPAKAGERVITEICITLFDHRVICMQAHIAE